MEPMVFLLGLLALFVYFIPASVALARSHHSTLAILALNLLLGWTFLGWVAALVWALTKVNASPN